MITNPEIEAYCKAHSKAESPILQALREYTETHVHGAHMLSGILVGRTLQLLLQLLKPKCVLDLGTFTGYSALSMAEALSSQGSVITCDQSPDILEIARSFFVKTEHGQKIQIFEGTVIDCIASIQTPIDFAFVDADKLKLLEYVEALYPKLSQGGIIVVDNTLRIRAGDVLNPQDKNVKAIDAFNAFIVKDSRFMNLLLPIRDGLHIMTKL